MDRAFHPCLRAGDDRHRTRSDRGRDETGWPGGRLVRPGEHGGVEGGTFRIHTPLIQLSKADIIKTGLRLGVDYADTVSCYAADAQGRACGKCDACRLSAAGFRAAGVADPTRYQ